jgi:hypothetical protein
VTSRRTDGPLRADFGSPHPQFIATNFDERAAVRGERRCYVVSDGGDSDHRRFSKVRVIPVRPFAASTKSSFDDAHQETRSGSTDCR